MNKAFQCISWITIIITLFLILLIGYWYLFNNTPIIFNKLPHTIMNENKTVKSGSYLMYQVDYCKNTKTIPTVTKTFVDGIVYVTPEVLATVKDVWCKVETIQVYVPKALPIGTYLLKTTYRYKLNPVKSVDVVTETERFTVVK